MRNICVILRKEKRFFRLKSLGEDYSEYSLNNRIENRNKIPNEF